MGVARARTPTRPVFAFSPIAIRALTETLSDFDRSIDWLLSGKHQDNQLEEAVLGVIAAMDKSSSPAG
jgi:hypothetical protein